MKISITILFTAVVSSLAFCQHFATYTYSIAEGVPSAETYEVFQDRRGFLWFGTDNGVCRFDGSQLEVFNVKDGLSDPVVFGISEDVKGRIWFRTYSGKLSYYHNEKFYSYQYNDVLAKLCETRIMLSLHCDSLDQVWFAASDIIGKIDARGVVDTIKTPLRTIEIRQTEGRQLIGYGGPPHILKKFRFNSKTYSFIQADSTQNYHVFCAEYWNDKLYVTVNNSIFQFDGKNLKRVHAGKGPIICMYRDHENNLWVGYMNKGVERFTDNFEMSTLSLFIDKSVSKILQDHEGGFWFSTLTNGIQYIPNLTVKNFIPLAYSRLKAIESFGDYILTGDYTGQVNAYNSVTGEIVWTDTLIDPIISLFKTSQGDLWISTTNQTFIYDSQFNRKRKIKGSRLAFHELEQNKILALAGNVIFTYDASGEIVDAYGGTSNFRSVIPDDSLLYFIVRSGFQVRNKNLDLIHDFNELKNVKVSKLLSLNDSTLMVCTVGNGFILVNKKNWKYRQFNSANSFSADNFYTALVTDSLVWFATEKGLGVSDIKSAVNGISRINYLTKKSGLTSNKVNFLAEGKKLLWAFTEEGISLIPITGAGFANKHPLFFLDDVLANDKSISGNVSDTEHVINLAHDENNLQFRYRCISFNNPNVLRRYRLSPEEPWIYSNNTLLLFPSLAPGNYLFELEFSADGIVWNPALEDYVINVNLPWWNLSYVQLAAFLVLAGLGYWYFKYQRSIYVQKNLYLKIINDHQQKLIQSEVVTRERERNRISKELHDRVGTNLTAIKLTVNQLLKQYNDPMAGDIEEQFQVAIKEIKDIIYGLTPPGLERYGLFTGLKNYIGKLKRTIPINISLKTFGKDTHTYELNILVFRILQELMSNTIKHSFAKSITIHINSFDDVLNIVYEDDGIGFSYNPEQSGLGLDNIESRIRSINGSLKFESGSFGISYEIDIPTLNKEIA